MRSSAPSARRLIGSVMTGHVRRLRHRPDVFTTRSPGPRLLEPKATSSNVERKQIVKHNEARRLHHVHVHDRFNFELTVYPRTRRTTSSRAPSPAGHRARPRCASWRSCGAPSTRTSTWRASCTPPRAAPDRTTSTDAPLAAENVRQSPQYHRATCCTTRCRSSSWRATRGPTTRSCCWRRCCTTSARHRPDRPRRAAVGAGGLLTDRTRLLIAPHGRAHYGRQAGGAVAAGAGGVLTSTT